MDVKGSIYNPGDFVPSGERLRATVLRGHLLGAVSDDTDAEDMACEDPELCTKEFNNFTYAALGTTTPSYEHLDLVLNPYGQPYEGPRVGARIRVVGFRVMMRATLNNTSTTFMEEAPATIYNGTVTKQPSQVLRLLLLCEFRGGRALNAAGAFSDWETAPGVKFDSFVDPSRSSNWGCLFDHRVVISEANPALCEEHWIDCDFPMEFSKVAPYTEAVTNKIWMVHFENQNAGVGAVAPVIFMRVMMYYYDLH